MNTHLKSLTRHLKLISSSLREIKKETIISECINVCRPKVLCLKGTDLDDLHYLDQLLLLYLQ